jgi:MFS family permease
MAMYHIGHLEDFLSDPVSERRGRARAVSLSTTAWIAGTLAIVCATTSAHAQRGDSIDHAPPSRASRVALGSSAALGVASITMAIPIGVTATVNGGSATPFYVAAGVGAAMTIGLAPLGYVLAGDATEGRGRYWAALLGCVGGAALGFVALPIQLLTSPPFSNNAGTVVAVSVLTPLLGFTGMAIGYELSHDSADRERDRESGRAASAGVRWAPSFAYDGRSMLLTVGGAL